MQTARRTWLMLMGALALGLVTTPRVRAQGLRIGQPAPALGGGPWLNSAPLTMEGLRGRVVLVEFWTYG